MKFKNLSYLTIAVGFISANYLGAEQPNNATWQKYDKACDKAMQTENWKATEEPCKHAVQEGEKIEPKLFLDSSLTNLALVYLHQKQYKDAEPLLKRSLAMREKDWGANHPLVVDRLGMLAMVYRKMNQSKEAQAFEVKLKQAQAACEKEISAEERKSQPMDPCNPPLPEFLR